MNNIGITTSTAFANVVTPFSPVGKQAVGLENADTKQDVLPPVVQPGEDAASADDKSDTENTQQATEKEQRERVEEREQRQQQQQEQREIAELAARDREVRAHEQAHAAVGGQYAGSPSFTYQRGPDGVNYAIGGEVPISLPQGGDNPEQTLAAAEQVQRAALAPADPSPQDRRVAASAANAAQEARAQIAEQRREEQRVDREEEAQKQRDTELEEQARADSVEQRETREQRLEELDAQARRSAQLGDRLVTLDNIQREQSVGSVLDQRV